MTPLCCQEAVIEVQPPNLSADVESTPDWVELVVGSGNPGSCGGELDSEFQVKWRNRHTVGNNCAFDHRTK